MDKGNGDRVVLSAKVSKESAEGWKRFCHGNGVSLSAMLEVAGTRLALETLPTKNSERQEMVRLAREIDIARRSRSRTAQETDS